MLASECAASRTASSGSRTASNCGSSDSTERRNDALVSPCTHATAAPVSRASQAARTTSVQVDWSVPVSSWNCTRAAAAAAGSSSAKRAKRASPGRLSTARLLCRAAASRCRSRSSAATVPARSSAAAARARRQRRREGTRAASATSSSKLPTGSLPGPARMGTPATPAARAAPCADAAGPLPAPNHQPAAKPIATMPASAANKTAHPGATDGVFMGLSPPGSARRRRAGRRASRG